MFSFIPQHSQPILCQYFVGHFEQLGGGEGFDAAVEGLGRVVAVVMQEGLGGAEGVVFVIVEGHAYLAGELFLGGV